MLEKSTSSGNVPTSFVPSAPNRSANDFPNPAAASHHRDLVV